MLRRVRFIAGCCGELPRPHGYGLGLASPPIPSLLNICGSVKPLKQALAGFLHRFPVGIRIRAINPSARERTGAGRRAGRGTGIRAEIGGGVFALVYTRNIQ